jgi:hypothetical protein
MVLGLKNCLRAVFLNKPSIANKLLAGELFRHAELVLGLRNCLNVTSYLAFRSRPLLESVARFIQKATGQFTLSVRKVALHPLANATLIRGLIDISQLSDYISQQYFMWAYYMLLKPELE